MSNFNALQLERLLSVAKVTPAVNQVADVRLLHCETQSPNSTFCQIYSGSTLEPSITRLTLSCLN